METPEPCRLTVPDQVPEFAEEPFSARVSGADAPAAIVTLDLSSVGVTPEPVAFWFTVAVNVTELDPALVSCTCCEAPPLVMPPKEKVAGALVTVAFTAAPASSRPLPETSMAQSPPQ